MGPMLDLASENLNYTPFQFSKASVIFLGSIGFLATFVNVGNIFYIVKFKRFSNAINYIVMFDSMVNLIGFLVMGIFSLLAMNSPEKFGNLGCTFSCWVIGTLASTGKNLYLIYFCKKANLSILIDFF